MAKVLVNGVEHEGEIELNLNDAGNYSIANVKLEPKAPTPPPAEKK